MSINVGRREYPHHTADQVAAYFAEAMQIVGELEVDGALAEALTLKAVDLLAAKQIMFEQVASGITLAGPH